MSTTADTPPDIRPFQIEIPQEQIDDLRRRIAATRWPTQELVTDRSTRVTYWEGACAVRPLPGSPSPAGSAYVELTGYAGKGALGLF